MFTETDKEEESNRINIMGGIYCMCSHMQIICRPTSNMRGNLKHRRDRDGQARHWNIKARGWVAPRAGTIAA